ncbi:AUGMIN subunit 8 [Lycium barbarum]|uniref:AUGMIN subunit 8 n=1 Tax=Lycium barbarum TaxID=112863 RepID=UPI00293F5A09|nr:AUGMIN subunit 8 [Lycium barbarum]XP_060171741.1 AUGMIN subunit 8 [Lycium barbarum]XP_060171742.1 AUGMIN subunit 8 [Lycium barbarum]XP_060171743.1 AUGMIN subunit 8 [Lycium barbarum]
MDVYESEIALKKHSSTVETKRGTPLIQPEKNNGNNTRRSRTREVSSRYRSPTPSTSSGPSRRCSSPNVTRIGTTTTTSTLSLPKRAISAERKRPTTPSSPTSRSPSTPVHDTSVEELLSRKLAGNRLPESLWPSTMRSLSVSFQSDTFSLPVGKREKPAPHALCDRTLRPSSNVVQKQGETHPGSRKATPERRRSPLKGKNSVDQGENSRPVDSLNARLVDQHRWPSRVNMKVVPSGSMNRSIDLSDKKSKIAPSLRRLSLDGYSKPLQKSSSDLLSLESSDDGVKVRGRSVDDNSLSMQKSTSSTSLDRTVSGNPVARAHTVSAPGSRFPSPNKASFLSSSASRGVSPSRVKSVPSTPSRGPSPSRIRPSSPSRQQPKTATSVLSFIADIKKGKKAANHIEDVHQLRLLYNRHLQWRYANARSDAALHAQKVKAEKTLYNVWRNTSNLWASVIKKRVALQQLKLKLKLFAVLNEQHTYLDEWASIEGDHTSSLSHVIQDLQACTLRLPITGRAKGDIEGVKEAVSSAVDVMQAMGSSMRFILSRMEGMNCLVSELADVAAQERAMLDECEALLASTAAMQVEEYSISSHLIQLKQAWRSDKQLILGN